MLQGMGEPLHNFEAVRRSISILCHPQGLQFSHNKVSVSTVGLVPEMEGPGSHMQRPASCLFACHNGRSTGLDCPCQPPVRAAVEWSRRHSP